MNRILFAVVMLGLGGCSFVLNTDVPKCTGAGGAIECAQGFACNAQTGQCEQVPASTSASTDSGSTGGASSSGSSSGSVATSSTGTSGTSTSSTGSTSTVATSGTGSTTAASTSTSTTGSSSSTGSTGTTASTGTTGTSGTTGGHYVSTISRPSGVISFEALAVDTFDNVWVAGVRSVDPGDGGQARALYVARVNPQDGGLSDFRDDLGPSAASEFPSVTGIDVVDGGESIVLSATTVSLHAWVTRFGPSATSVSLTQSVSVAEYANAAKLLASGEVLVVGSSSSQGPAEAWAWRLGSSGTTTFNGSAYNGVEGELFDVADVFGVLFSCGNDQTGKQDPLVVSDVTYPGAGIESDGSGVNDRRLLSLDFNPTANEKVYAGTSAVPATGNSDEMVLLTDINHPLGNPVWQHVVNLGDATQPDIALDVLFAGPDVLVTGYQDAYTGANGTSQPFVELLAGSNGTEVWRELDPNPPVLGQAFPHSHVMATTQDGTIWVAAEGRIVRFHL